MSQMELPTTDQAEERRDAGMATANQHAGQTWIEYATDYVEAYLIDHDYLFCDDVWEHGLVKPDSSRAFGQVMKNALRYGWMSKTSMARPSVQSNMSLRSIYRSSLRGQPAKPYPVFVRTEAPA